MYFVNYNLDKDALSQESKFFDNFDSLFDFIQTIKPEGLNLEIYEAKKLTDEDFRLKCLESLTEEAQKLGFYD